MELLQSLDKHVVVLDGAMGTMIQSQKLTDADFGGSDYRMLSDLLTFSHPEIVESIHLAYFRAGADAVETNTFGASPFRLSEYDFSGLDLARFAPIPYEVDLRTLSCEDFAYFLSRAGAEAACRAREAYRRDEAYDGRPLFVIGSIGPSNRVLSSTRAELRKSTFDAVVDNFYHQVRGLIDGGASVLLYETQQDILELKAAVFGGLKAMEEKGVRLPIMAQVTVDQYSRMQIFNTDIHAALVTLAGTGIDVFGINCSIGPDLMEPTVEMLSRYSPLPISIIPNAGLPVSESGKTVFKFPPNEMAQILRRFVDQYGVNIVGGCCGTTPDHIRAISEAVRDAVPKKREPEPGLYVSGPQKAVLLDSSQTLIRFGERLNVRGSKKVRDAVESGGPIDHDVLDEVVAEQTRELGLDVIDICMDSNAVDTTETLKEVIHVQTTDFPGAMCIDSFAVDALVEAVKVYPGRPILNSISNEEVEPGITKADAVISATRQHCPVYIGLCTGPKGPGSTTDEKVELAMQILANAAKYEVGPERIFIDVNVFPIGSESVPGMNFALETLEAVRRVKEMEPRVRTTLGVGNLTTGLASKPYMRMVLTSVFLDEARKRGLDAAIVNPNHYVFVSNLDKEHYELGRRVILDHDMEAFASLEVIAAEKKGDTVARRTTYDDLSVEAAICEKVKDGFKEREAGTLTKNGHEYSYADRIVMQVAEVIDCHAPLDFINEYLMTAMQELGDGFARGEVSLPHLLKSADVMQQVMRFLEEYMRVSSGVELHGEIRYKGTVVVGTVYQDVHSIGKDLAKTLLENYGYRVIDLGTMTPLQTFIDIAKKCHADAIGMSALLVQTSNHMITVSKMMIEQGLADLPVLIGGAPVNERHAAYVAMAGEEDTSRMRSNVFYCRTAMDGVNVMNSLMSAPDRKPIYDQNHKRLVAKFLRAEEMALEEAELLARLPRRTVSFAPERPDGMPIVQWEPCKAETFGRRRIEIPLREFAPRIDTRTLFSLNWRFGGTSQRKKTGTEAEYLLGLFDEWIERCSSNGWLRPQGVFGLFPCQSEGDEVLVYASGETTRELCRFNFTPVIGADRKDKVSGAEYFHPESSGVVGVVGVQITTAGPQVEAEIARMKAAGDSESALFLQGLSDRIAEDMADHVHALMREIVGMAGMDAGTRWSPGYPGMANIMNNRTLLELLDATNEVGVQITEAGEFIPTGTTGAVVSFHPDARYLQTLRVDCLRSGVKNPAMLKRLAKPLYERLVRTRPVRAMVERERHRLAVEPFSEAVVNEFIEGECGKAHGVGPGEKSKLVEQFRRCNAQIQSGTSPLVHITLARELLNIPREVEGNVVECGTWKGASAAALSLVCSHIGRRLYVCDSFQGLPDDDGKQPHYGPHVGIYGYYKKGMFEGSLGEVKANIARCGNLDVCEFVEGFFSESLKALKSPLVMAFLDVDLVNSTQDCLKHLWPLLVEDAAIYTDDAGDMPIVKVYFDEKWWQDALGCPAPGLIGSGCGLPLNPHASSLGYTRKTTRFDPGKYKRAPFLHYPDDDPT